MEVKKEKLDITLAKGVAITLVVVGHILAGSRSEGNEWFSTLVEYIYLFHMPFFMFLSGFLFFKQDRLNRILGNYRGYLKAQTIRLLLPFFFIGASIVIGKLFMQQFVHVDNIPDNIFQGFINLIWHTKHSASIFLWYIYCLFIYGATSAALFQFIKDKMYIWISLGLVLFLLPRIEYLYLDKLTTFFVFFALGCTVRQYSKFYMRWIENKKVLLTFLILFIGSFYFYETDVIDYKYNKLIVGSISMPALHCLCLYFQSLKNRVIDITLYMGRNSYTIYLLNTICIGLTKAFLFLFVNWDYQNFLFIAPTLILAGLAGPIIAQKLFLEHIPFIKRFLRAK